MVLKKNYSLNNIIKHSQYAQFKNKLVSFTLKKLLTKNPVFKKTAFSFQTGPFFFKKNDALVQYLFSKMTQSLGPSPFYQNRWLFLDNKKYLGHKRIQTQFQSIVKDQKKRAAFAQNELKKVTLKALLSISHKTLNSPRELVNKYQKQNNSDYPKFGPILFLDKTLNGIFTKKTRSFSRIRNHCLLTGKPTIIGKFRLSRIYFRQYAGSGRIPGLTKNRN